MSTDSSITATDRVSMQRPQSVESQLSATQPAEARGGSHPCSSTAARSDISATASASTTAASAANSVTPALGTVAPHSAHLAEIGGDIYTGALDLGYSLASDITVDSTSCGLLNLGNTLRFIACAKEAQTQADNKQTNREQTDKEQPRKKHTDRQNTDRKQASRKQVDRKQTDRKHTDNRQIGDKQQTDRGETDS